MSADRQANNVHHIKNFKYLKLIKDNHGFVKGGCLRI